MEETVSARKRIIDPLDILRLFAALSVFLLHATIYTGVASSPDSVFFHYLLFPAWAGVWVFFLLGGIVFSLGMERDRWGVLDENGRFRIRGILRCYLARFLRIAPLYYLYILFFELFNGGILIAQYPAVLVRMIFFVYNGLSGPDGVGHLWYLSTAMQLYLFAPFFYWTVRLLNQKSPRWVILAFSVVGVLGFAWRVIGKYASLDWNTWTFTFFASNIDLFFCGIALPFLRFFIKRNTIHRIVSSVLLIGLIAFNMACPFNGYLAVVYSYGLPSAYIVVCGYFYLSFCIEGRSKGVFSILAKHTYSFYVFHIISMIFAVSLLPRLGYEGITSPDVRHLLVLAVSFLAASLLSIVFTDLFPFAAKAIKKSR